MFKALLLIIGIILAVCVLAFIKKTRLGGSGGYKNKRPPGE